MTYMYNTWMSFSLKKEGNPDVCDKKDEPREHYAKWNKPIIEE